MIYKGDDLHGEIEVDTDLYDVEECPILDVKLSDYMEIGNVNMVTDNLHDEQKLELFLENINDIRLEEFEQMIKQWKDEKV